MQNASPRSRMRRLAAIAAAAVLAAFGVAAVVSGINGQSTVRRVELTTGKVLQQVAVPPEHFGEGLEQAVKLALTHPRKASLLGRTLIKSPL